MSEAVFAGNNIIFSSHDDRLLLCGGVVRKKPWPQNVCHVALVLESVFLLKILPRDKINLFINSGVVRGAGNFKFVGFNQATGLVSPLRRQICLNPVWLGELRSSASLRSPSDRSEPSQPTRQTGFRQICLLAADQTGWLD